MAKSLGNFVTARDALKQYPPLAIRFFMLSAHYRSPINFSRDSLEQSAAGVERLRNCRSDLDFAAKTRTGDSAFDMDKYKSQLEDLRVKFTEAMNDDFNTAAAMGILFDLVYLMRLSPLISSRCRKTPSTNTTQYSALLALMKRKQNMTRSQQRLSV